MVSTELGAVILDGEEEGVPEIITWRGEPFLEHRGGAKSGP